MTATKPDHVSSTFRSHTVEGENSLPKVVLGSLPFIMVHVPPSPPQIHKSKPCFQLLEVTNTRYIGQGQNNLPSKATGQLGGKQVQIVTHGFLEQFWGKTEFQQGRKPAYRPGMGAGGTRQWGTGDRKQQFTSHRKTTLARGASCALTKCHTQTQKSKPFNTFVPSV